MILEMDVGNSRIKWRFLSKDGSCVFSGIDSGALSLNSLERRVGKPTRVRIACVRDQAFKQALRNDIQSCWAIQPEFAESCRQVGGVINAYDEPGRLGVDRWLAMLAAYNLVSGACIVVDAGSAITLDCIQGNGQHVGGYIVPGLQMQRESLLSRTSITLSGIASWDSDSLGVNSFDAIHHGILSMVTHWIMGICASRTGERWTIILTGGDSQVIERHLYQHGIDTGRVPALVMDGLAIALP